MFENQAPVYAVCFNDLFYTIRAPGVNQTLSSEKAPVAASEPNTTTNELKQIGAELESRLSDIDQKIQQIERDNKARRIMQKKQMVILERCTP